jgi:hypothetical protein
LKLVLHVITGPVGATAGKCGHGGLDDESRKLIAKCGINKETTLEELSPHFHLHNDAYYAVVAATKNFLIAEGKSNHSFFYCVLLTCRKHLHDGIISQRGEAWAHQTCLTPPLLSKYLHHARKVSGDVFVC